MACRPGTAAAWALDDVTLDIPAGRLVSVIGPNGSGKSTLLRAILGLVPQRRGTVSLGGVPIDQRRTDVAYVPQRELVDWSFPISAAQVVMMGRFPRIGLVRGSAAVDRHAVAGALDRVRHGGPRRPADRRAVGRPAAAGVRGARAGPGGVGPAARRAHDRRRSRHRGGDHGPHARAARCGRHDPPRDARPGRGRGRERPAVLRERSRRRLRTARRSIHARDAARDVRRRSHDPRLRRPRPRPRRRPSPRAHAPRCELPGPTRWDG